MSEKEAQVCAAYGCLTVIKGSHILREDGRRYCIEHGTKAGKPDPASNTGTYVLREERPS